MSELNWYHTAIVLLVVSTLFYAALAIRPYGLFREGGWGLMLLSCLCLLLSLVMRSFHAQYFALSNMYESLLVVSIGIQFAFLILDRWFKLRLLGLSVALLLLAALLFDGTLSTEIHPLQPALQSYWRSIHVPVILLSYALFTISFLSSVVYLVRDFFFKPNLSHPSRQLASTGPDVNQPAAQLSMDSAMDSAMLLSAEMARLEEKVNVYDEITYRCVAFGFPLLTLGIILGGLWANEAWGNYWSWDPKESMSLVTLLGYGVFLHLRVNGGHSSRTLAFVSVAGFILMLITYFGVNLMGVGLHSYGRIG